MKVREESAQARISYTKAGELKRTKRGGKRGEGKKEKRKKRKRGGGS